MGKHYRADVDTPFWTAFWKNQRACKFVEETEGAEGSGVYMYRNLFNREGETKAQNLCGNQTVGGKKVGVEEGLKAVLPVATAMSSARNLDARRRLSQSAQLRGSLPLMAEA